MLALVLALSIIGCQATCWHLPRLPGSADDRADAHSQTVVKPTFDIKVYRTGITPADGWSAIAPAH
jgi:hypothetical protein